MNEKILTSVDDSRPIIVSDVQIEENIGHGEYSGSVCLVSAKVKDKTISLVEKTPNKKYSFISKISHILTTHKICKDLKIPTFPTLRTDGENLYSTPFFEPEKFELLTANNDSKISSFLEQQKNISFADGVCEDFENVLQNTRKKGIIIRHKDAFGFLLDRKSNKIIKIIIADFDNIGYYDDGVDRVSCFVLQSENLKHFHEAVKGIKWRYMLLPFKWPS
ncbi:hypothetical protein KGV55_03450 [Candidatus Gracilibacteria bacterium]|nr:hypothetical protein [Candidatus Gracilibacteria bacterium]